MDAEPGGTEEGRDLPTALAPVQEQVGQPRRVPDIHGSGSDASRDAHRVLELVDGHAVLIRDDIEGLPRPKHRQAGIQTAAVSGDIGMGLAARPKPQPGEDGKHATVLLF